jgi:indolepyruvate ferredoxin oxidoreductase alpha subunit
VSFPSLVTKAHREIVERLPIIADLFSNYPNLSSHPTKIGIAASGISWAYLLDSLESLPAEARDSLRLFRVATPFPFVDKLAVEFLTGLETVIVFEELEPVVERELLRVAGANQIAIEILGKLTGHTAIAGENSVALISQQLLELFTCRGGHWPPSAITGNTGDQWSPLYENDTVANVGAAIGRPAELSASRAANGRPYKASTPNTPEPPAPPASPARPPVLCAGCPHRASFSAVKRALRGKQATFSGDIGCYTLGNALPLDMVDSCVCMGAGFTVPQGMYWAQPDVRHLGFVGDSTFFASGMTGVANAVYNRAPVTLFVLDNSITAMTGSQPHPGTGLRVSFDGSPSDIANAIDIAAVLKAMGVKHVVEQNPLQFEQAVEVVRTAVEFDGVSAVVFKAPCINVAKPQPQPGVDTYKCTACRACINTLGCPALGMLDSGDKDSSYIEIDDALCYGCDLCVQICPFNALISNHKGGANAI